MRRLAAALATIALILTPVAAEAKPRVDRGCVIAAVQAHDIRAFVACFDGGTGASAQRIDWD